MNQSRRHRGLVAVTAAALTLTACGGGDPLANGGEGEDSGSIVVGGADFSESILLAEIYAGALQAQGVEATTKTGIGSREVYLKALEEGSVDVMPEYTGGLARYTDEGFNETDPEETYTALKKSLPKGMTLLEKSAAENKDSMVVTQQTQKKYDLQSVADLKPVADELVLGAPSEFKTRPQGIPGLKKTYGITFGKFRPLKPGQATNGALKNGQIDVADIFSTDPAIAANNFVVLDDPKKHFGSQNIVPLVRTGARDEVAEALNAVSEKLTTAKLQQMLKRTDIDKEDPETVAQDFLTEEGLD